MGLKGMSIIKKVCDARSLIIFSLDAHSVRQGATIGYGPSWQEIGTQTALIIRDILEDDKKSPDISIKNLSVSYQLFIPLHQIKIPRNHLMHSQYFQYHLQI